MDRPDLVFAFTALAISIPCVSNISGSTYCLSLFHDEHPFHPCSSSHGPSFETLRHGKDDNPWVWEAFSPLSDFCLLYLYTNDLANFANHP